jgi:hypothetical protein
MTSSPLFHVFGIAIDAIPAFNRQACISYTYYLREERERDLDTIFMWLPLSIHSKTRKGRTFSLTIDVICVASFSRVFIVNLRFFL